MIVVSVKRFISKQSPRSHRRFLMAAHLKLVAPTSKNQNLTPRRRPNRELRTREHLTTDEVERLIEAAKTNRNGHRDATMVLLAFRHALRAATCAGTKSTSIRPSCTSVGTAAHRARTLDIKAHAHMLRHACGFALANAGHDTRSLQAYLGHKNIQHTVRYTELAPDRFKDFWR
jgi:site-specific recombinase XerD